MGLASHSDSGVVNERIVGVKSDTTSQNIAPEGKDDSKTTNKKSKSSTKKARDPSTLTPEYIEEQRRLRDLRKEKKRKELISKGLNPDQDVTPPHLKFRTRDLLALPNTTEKNGLKVKILTYNILAQALIRRKLFPTNGNALKWSIRSKVLLAEFKHYDADIICLQELDYIQYNSYWSREFEELGYNSKYYRANAKNHGLAIVFKSDLFICKNQSFIKYDKEQSDNILPRTITQNVGLLVYLEFTPSIKSKYPKLARNGIIVGTTHLFWHPFGTYERSRQTYLVLKKFKEFYDTLFVLSKNSKGFYSFFTGDFNSQPFDAPYLSITSKPASYTGRVKTVLCCSLSFQYSKHRGVTEDEEEEYSIQEEEGGDIEKYGKDQPKDPVPDTFEPTDEQLELVQQMEDLHNSLDMRAISLYSIGYKLVDPKNAGIDNDRNEPLFSNWAHSWRGLLDYIFIISKWDKETERFNERVDSIEDVANQQNIRLLKLLKLPLPEDMGPEPSGQPRLGQFPSDHLCLIAEVELS